MSEFVQSEFGSKGNGSKRRSIGKESNFEPKIVVFACNWCSYAGADTAGIGRLQYPPNVRLIRVMCSGRIRPAFVLKAFELGADGVMWSGCHFGDCHYVFGNYRAEEQFEITKGLVKMLGLEKERLRLEWVSAAEGGRWAELIKEFVEDVKKVGPSPLRKKKEDDKRKIKEEMMGT